MQYLIWSESLETYSLKLLRKDEDAGLGRLLTQAVHRTLILPVDPSRGEAVCRRLAIQPGSLFESFAKTLGGTLVDQSWIHLFGSGNRTHYGLLEWNTDPRSMVSGMLLVGMDAVGGAFAVNRSLGIASRGEVCYFSPQALRWKPTGMVYDVFLEWAMLKDLNRFYADTRWPGWEMETHSLQPNHGITTSPPLSKEGNPVGARPRMSVAMKDLWQGHLEASKA